MSESSKIMSESSKGYAMIKMINDYVITRDAGARPSPIRLPFRAAKRRVLTPASCVHNSFGAGSGYQTTSSSSSQGLSGPKEEVHAPASYCAHACQDLGKVDHLIAGTAVTAETVKKTRMI